MTGASVAGVMLRRQPDCFDDVASACFKSRDNAATNRNDAMLQTVMAMLRPCASTMMEGALMAAAGASVAVVML